MENLEYDRLSQIFENLGPVDQITVAGTHPRFIPVIRRLIGKKEIDIEQMNRCFSSEQLTNFLSECGRSVKHIVVNGYSPQWFAPFAKYCPNIEKVDISRVNDDDYCKDLGTFFKTCRNLRVVNLTSCDMNGEALFKSFQNLQSLHIFLCGIDGRGFSHLINLIELNLIHCENVIPANLQSMLQANKKLKTLKISGCPSLTNANIGSTLVKHENIERLSLGIQFFRASFALSGLPSLKHIEIYSDYLNGIEIPFFEQLCKNNSRNLESLRLISWSFPPNKVWPPFPSLTKITLLNARNLSDSLLKNIGEACKLLKEADFMESMMSITDGGLLNFIRASRNLSYLEIGAVPHIDKNLIISIGEIRRAMHATEPLTIACLCSKWEAALAGRHDDMGMLLKLIKSKYESRDDEF